MYAFCVLGEFEWQIELVAWVQSALHLNRDVIANKANFRLHRVNARSE